MLTINLDALLVFGFLCLAAGVFGVMALLEKKPPEDEPLHHDQTDEEIVSRTGWGFLIKDD